MTPIDIEQPAELTSYLIDHGHVDASDILTCTPLSGGVSARTVRVDLPGRTGIVIKQALPKLRVKEDWFADPERIVTEAMALEVLPSLIGAEHLPGLQFLDLDQHLLGMDAIPASSPVWKSELMSGRVDSDLVEQFGRILAHLHNHSQWAASRIPTRFSDRDMFETLRIEPYYRFSQTRCPELAGFIDALIEDTLATTDCLVHGDYSPKNILVNDGCMVLIDHEVAHLGDPAFDVGFGLTHLLSKANQFKELRDVFLEAARTFWTSYLASRNCGLTETQRIVRHTIGCLTARVVGRSPLEYLGKSAAAFQVETCIRLAEEPPKDPERLIEVFFDVL